MLKFDERDVVTLAKTLEGEARGEPDDGKAAIAWVIVNRAKKVRFAGGGAGLVGAIARVCLAPAQFSCWNEGDPNRPYLLKAPAEAYAAERAIAELVLEGVTPDPTNGADHYHTIDPPPWADRWPPDWASDNPPNKQMPMAEVARFGGHVFYNSEVRR